MSTVPQVLCRQTQAGPTESVGEYGLRASLYVLPVDSLDGFQIVYVPAFAGFALRQTSRLQHGAHGAVGYDDLASLYPPNECVAPVVHSATSFTLVLDRYRVPCAKGPTCHEGA
jgi:hypothetical protein